MNKNEFESNFFKRNIFYTNDLNELKEYANNDILIYSGTENTKHLKSFVTHEIFKLEGLKSSLPVLKARRLVQKGQLKDIEKLSLMLGKSRFIDYKFSTNVWIEYKLHIIKTRILRGAHFKVVMSNDLIVGFLVYSIQNKTLKLLEIGVLKKFQGGGVAIDLLASVFKEDFSCISTSVYSDNIDSIRLWKHLNFKKKSSLYYGTKN